MERETWRWLDLGRQGPYENAAVMPVLVRSVAERGEPIAQTSVWGETHLNVGWFDDVDSTLDLAACERNDVRVVRRSFYGGGTAYYESECSMMWGFLLPRERAGEDLDALLARFQGVVSAALAEVGLGEVGFEGSSDLRWNGRKLGALTAQDVVACVSVGGFLNLAPPDLSTYLKVVRIPEDKFKDKVVKNMTEYVCTAEEVAGERVTYEQVRDALVAALADDGIDLRLDVLDDGERKGFAKLSERVRSPDSIRRISSDRFTAQAPAGSAVGLGNHKGRKLCRAGVALTPDDRIAAAMFAGDMHASPPDVLEKLAEAVVGGDPRDEEDLRRRISGIWESGEVSQADDTMGVTTEDLLAALRKAIDSAVPR